MGIIKSYDQFVNENLFDELTGKRQIAELQTKMIGYCQYVISHSTPEDCPDADGLFKYLEDVAEEKYENIVTAKLAVSFSKWWKEFIKNYTPMVDELIKDIKQGKIKDEDIDEEELEQYDPEEPGE